MTSPAMPSMRHVKRVSVVLIWVDSRVSEVRNLGAYLRDFGAHLGAHFGHAGL